MCNQKWIYFLKYIFRQLGGNNISVINNRSSLPSSLKTLSLEKNKISEIQPGTFSLNTNLSIL